MKKYNCLIVGCGKMGCLSDIPGSGNEHKIISFAKAVKEHEGFNLTCFVEPNENNAFLACNNYDVHTYMDIETAFKFEFIDVAIVTTPDETHYSILKQLLEYHKRNPFKLCLCEKPLCETAEEAKEIIDLYRKADIALMVDYTRRFIPELRDLKKRYDNGEFGKLIDYTLMEEKKLTHGMSHLTDFMNWFFNGQINIKWRHMPHIPYRVYRMELFFEKFYWCEQRIKDAPVQEYFDLHTKYVMDNVYNVLQGIEVPYCNAEDGLKALELLGV